VFLTVIIASYIWTTEKKARVTVVVRNHFSFMHLSLCVLLVALSFSLLAACLISMAVLLVCKQL
jgi:hypothetical protein